MSCDAGQYLTGGGCNANSAPYKMQYNGPVNETTWRCGGHHSSKHVWALCTNDKKPVVKSLVGGDWTVVECDAGQRVTGGGCHAMAPPHDFQYNGPLGASAWQCGGHGGVKTAYAICSSDDEQVTTTTTTAANFTPQFVFECAFGVPLLLRSNRGEQLTDLGGPMVWMNAAKGTMQTWEMYEAQGATVYLTSKNSHRQLEDRNGKVGMSKAHAKSQEWTIKDAGDGKIFLTSHRDKQLEDRHGQPALDSDTGHYQMWSVLRTSDNTNACGQREVTALEMAILNAKRAFSISEEETQLAFLAAAEANRTAIEAVAMRQASDECNEQVVEWEAELKEATDAVAQARSRLEALGQS